MTDASSSISEYLRDLPPNIRELAEGLRTLVTETLPEVEERIRWGNLNFAVNGKEVAWVTAHKNHVNFGFPVGARLRSKLLEGTGKNMRHITVASPSDIKKNEFARLLRQAKDLVQESN